MTEICGKHVKLTSLVQILQTNKIQHTNYELLVSKLLKGEPLPQDLSPDEMCVPLCSFHSFD